MKKTNEKLQLQATKRDIFGKKLRKMRHNGMVPANIYGPEFTSLAITMSYKDFVHAHKIAHETGVVYIQVDKQEIPTLIKELQRHPVSDALIHVDFRKINLSEKIETDVPLVFINESPAVNQLGGQLLTQTNEVLIDALPTNIPENIEIDLALLTEIGSEIRVKDITAVSDYSIKEDPDRLIVSVVARKEESITPETEAVETEITTEKKDGEDGESSESEAKEAPAAEEKPDKN